MKFPDSPHTPALRQTAATVEARLAKHGVKLTLGGEPTFVPDQPEGSEWSITALGPTKLRHGYTLAEALIAQSLPNTVVIYSPGKHYPGETNPRWSLNLVWREDGAPLFPAALAGGKTSGTTLRAFCDEVLRLLRVKGKWFKAADLTDPKRQAFVLPLDHDGKRFVIADWQLRGQITLLNAEGSAGLRLPLNSLPPDVSRRALTAEIENGQLNIFLPPLLQAPWIRLLTALAKAASSAKAGAPVFSGYVPPDDEKVWSRLAIAADPGVLEINLPPCPTWQDYADWLARLESAAAACALRSCKQILPDEQAGTGGGNHLLFGGPTLEENPLFTHPRWLVGMLRYWQRHPALAYLFTGHYVGSASQAPRPDESASSLYDLEMAYQFLEELPPGDHRNLIGETLRHLHTDSTGNTHRSEISFDKFWNQAFDGGCRGLVEFRAVESLPHAEWMAAIALLWRAIAAMLLERKSPLALHDHGVRLHDAFFLPSVLQNDLRAILREVRQAGFALPEALFDEIFEWRFPEMLGFQKGAARLSMRKALEPWPLLCETPLEGGSTSRFVDTSIERLEFLGNAAFVQKHRIFVQSRELTLEPAERGRYHAGLRYRRSAWYPSLHPGILPHMPLVITLTDAAGKPHSAWEFTGATRRLTPRPVEPLQPARPCRKLRAELVTRDLRIV